MAIKRTRKRAGARRFSRPQKFQQLDGAHIDYRDPNGLLKFLTDRGKILSRRITGISAKKQRELGTAIKRARFLGLLPVGSAKRK